MSSQVIERLVSIYKDFVIKNPQLVSELETGTKWISYFITGNSDKSAVLSELLLSSANLVTLVNDDILRKSTLNADSRNPSGNKVDAASRIRTCLAVLDYVEVFAELTSLTLWGETGRFVVVLAVIVMKVIWRLVLILKFKAGVLTNPLTAPVIRNKPRSTAVVNENNNTVCNSSNVLTLKRSGRIMKSIVQVNGSYATNIGNRCEIKFGPTKLESPQLTAEVVYALRPLVHFLLMRMCKPLSWKPWVVACGMDFMSLQVLQKGADGMTDWERKELLRRRLMLLLYFIRTPFFDKYSKGRILALLRLMSETIPLTRLICNPLIDYLPQLQKTYFYAWSS